ncbi:response regulator [Dethiobacter alkaliphilus]|uniref:response regulator n=1 Tax=Dethiobacter alkaliphilus TaxID=427926 RepID=UPI002226F19F|nr:response regulator transcription factor [Dethiobacter alkaliphilus]MCW3490595.1 response regulator transcription factor [Dethiobacter alkaliphilus]
MSNSTISLLIVDDHDMVRRGLTAYLGTQPDIAIVGEASSGREAVQVAQKLRPEVILMDLLMEDGNGIEATRDILATHAECKIIILTSFYDDEQVFPALEAGAFSYLLKTARGEDIARAIRGAAAGEPVIEAKVATKMAGRLRGTKTCLHDRLTARELDVLRLLGDGKTNQEIGEQLVIGIKTVKTHVSNILNKLELQDRTQAAIYANRQGLVK